MLVCLLVCLFVFLLFCLFVFLGVFCFVLFFVVLGFELRALHMLDKSSITDPHSQPMFKRPQGVLSVFSEHL